MPAPADPIDWSDPAAIRAGMAARLARALDAASGPETDRQRLLRAFRATNRRRGIFGLTAAQRRALAGAGEE